MKKKVTSPKIREFKLSQLKESGYNPRTIDDEAMAGLTASIEKFGLVEPIIVNTRGGKNIIIGGHQRYKALMGLYGPGHKCRCVTVNKNRPQEKALNVTLNNPAVQGEFVDGLSEHIQSIKDELADDGLFLELRMDKLRDEIKQGGDDCIYREEKLKPFKRTHVLLSFEPQVLPEIADHLLAIMKIGDVEYEQASN